MKNKARCIFYYIPQYNQLNFENNIQVPGGIYKYLTKDIWLVTMQSEYKYWTFNKHYALKKDNI